MCLVTKPLMVLDAMITSPDHEWIVWTDDDEFINSGMYGNLDIDINHQNNVSIYDSIHLIIQCVFS